MREAQIMRKTNETDIALSLALDGKGKCEVDSGSRFFDHMLQQLAKHGAFDLNVQCNGDTEVDFHHSAEDIGICLGSAVEQALGDKLGIRRYGSRILPAGIPDNNRFHIIHISVRGKWLRVRH